MENIHRRLGEVLIEQGWITENQCHQALVEQARSRQRLGEILLSQQAINEDMLLSALSMQLSIERVDLSRCVIDSQAVSLLSEVQARRLNALVIKAEGNKVWVAMCDPSNLRLQEGVFGQLSSFDVVFLLCDAPSLAAAFERHYRRTHAITEFAKQLGNEQQKYASSAFSFDTNVDDDATITKLIQSLFDDALQMGASDIHIEPDDGVLRVRQRIDGHLQEMLLPDPTIANALVLRLKLMSGLDIAEKRLPQDGRFPFDVGRVALDVRLSTLPLAFGEAVVMRLLNPKSNLLTLDNVGLSSSLLETVRQQLRRPHGLILVTGPTGSGKTTTLYGALSELNTPEIKMITVEDPIEYRLPRVNQVQVNSKIGLDFSQVLRSVLRQDPDVLLIGEMRDSETVETGLRAALTGHLVLSTLHTNRAVDAPLRLMDMGAEGYLVASSVNAIIGQRLVRRVCSNCRTVVELSETQRSWLMMRSPDLAQANFVLGEGCSHCHFTGYRGRIGVFECLVLSDAMRAALRLNNADQFTLAVQQDTQFESCGLAALRLATEQITSFEEAFRLCEGTML